ncbi:MAG: carboxypeptidase-like regulatory domain-containing protein, partial [Rhodothermales bacterium]
RIAVQVTNFYPPRAGLEDIRVNVTPGFMSGRTDNAGFFVTPGLPGGSYDIEVTRDGYATLDTTVQVSAGQTTELSLPLPGLPTFQRFELSSLHVSRWFPPPEELFSLEIEAELADHDGLADIDSLWVSIDDFAFSQLLFVEVAPGMYRHSIPSGDLPVGLTALLGQEVQLEAKDRSGAFNVSGPKSVIRVINETPIALDPLELMFVGSARPTFTWEPLALDFPFTFRLDVVRIDQNIQSTILTIEDIPSSNDMIEAPTSIAPGDYFWTVSVVDEFGNRSRSREAGFRIQ